MNEVVYRGECIATFEGAIPGKGSTMTICARHEDRDNPKQFIVVSVSHVLHASAPYRTRASHEHSGVVIYVEEST